ncbi:hypothetical protein QR680_008130 [Steinernema hermaphroditum]|uniref:C-type lectin domain-containing protein n=1 Tax=Steinernema hermaphroditum TaxID=289476 RepID=A0AA39IFI2_9BILA|nr:hypothetical protein QR680_008130 [Steinernema hermaphroditum]
MRSTIPCLLLFLMLGYGVESLRVRYSRLPYTTKYTKNENETDEVVVNTRSECMLLAYRKNKIAFFTTKTESGLKCTVMGNIVSFTEEKHDENNALYMLDIGPSDRKYRCDDPSQMNVMTLMEGTCEAEQEMCDQLKSLHDFCKEKANNPTCTVKCPEGQKTVNGARDCCAFITDKNGTEKCCPADTHPRKSIDGLEMCCPKDGPCCPEGYKFDVERAGGNICCPHGTQINAGEVLKDPFMMSLSCCPPSMTPRSLTCCPKDFEYMASFKKCIGFIPVDLPGPQTLGEMKKLCEDLHALPVKIDNKEQNDALVEKAELYPHGAYIGLAIMDEEQKAEKRTFRWIADDSQPTYTYWLPPYPDLTHPDKALVQCVESRVRYSKWPYRLRSEKSDSKNIVKSKWECMIHAYKEKRIAYYTMMDLRGMYCNLLEDISFTDEISPKNYQAYILDTRPKEDGCQCNDTSKMDVRKFFEGPCEAGEEICNEVKRMNTYCITKANNPSCTPVECPEGQKALDGSECCYAHKHPNGTEVCCPENTRPKKIDGEDEMCCPEEGPCCREGYTFQQEQDGRDICCPNGTEFKGLHLSKPVCCPSTMVRIADSSTCHPANFQYMESFRKYIGMVKIGILWNVFGKTRVELMKLCEDENALPVKIDNKEQNDALKALNIDKTHGAAIGLAIPEGEQWGKDSFRWMADGSKPTWSNWLEGQPDNAGPTEILVKLTVDNMQWEDVAREIPTIICMAEPYEGTEKENGEYMFAKSFLLGSRRFQNGEF